MLHSPAGHPLLLVSVRNAQEACLAVRGGADIIDVKEPRHGSLGKAADQTIAEIAQSVRSLDPSLPITAALGELRDWNSAPAIPHLPREMAYLKLGLSECAHDADWPKSWREFRQRIAETCFPAPRWVAVIYADWQTAKAPPPREILKAAGDASCAAVLVDTFHKDGRSLLEILPHKELGQLARQVHQSGRPLAVAGGLRRRDIPRILPLKPRIIAIRSAACQDAKREGEICPGAVRAFREALAKEQPSPGG